MKKNNFLDFIPMILILLGCSLWAKTLFLDQPINTSEELLYDFWEESQAVTNPILKASNDSVRTAIAQAITHRPDDISILQAVDTILLYQEKILNALNDDKINHAQVYQTYVNQLKRVCFDEIKGKRPTILDEEINYLFEDINGLTAFDGQQESHNGKVFFQNRIILASTKIIDFCAKQIGSTIICDDWFIPELLLNPTLKKGVTSKGAMFLGYSGICEMSKNGYPKAFRINGKEYIEKNRRLNYTTVFQDTLPKKVVVERDLLFYKVVNNKLVESIETVFQDFIIYPSKQ